MTTKTEPAPIHHELAALVAAETAARHANDQVKARRIHRRIERLCKSLPTPAL